MKISIIVPVYNVEQYIKECFDSIAAQTYKGEIECIFVDDCGQDNSVAVLVKLIAEYNGPIQFSIVHHEHNKGVSGARNTGIRNAQGDYLYFIDSDDSITPDCIEKLVALAEKYPGVEMVQGSTKSHRSWLSLQDKQLPCYSSDRHWIMQAMLARYIIPLTSWNKMIIKPLVINENLFFEEGLVHEDEMWNFILGKKHIRTIAFCFEDTYIYRENTLPRSPLFRTSRRALDAQFPSFFLRKAPGRPENPSEIPENGRFPCGLQSRNAEK